MAIVKDLLEEVAHETKRAKIDSAVNIFQAINNVISTIFLELQKRGSDTIKGSLAVTITGGENLGALPEDFAGFMTRPYVSGQRKPLVPINPEDKLMYDGQTTQIPKLFDLLDTEIQVFPVPDQDITIKGDYAKRPVDVAAITDTVPYSDKFLSTIRNGIFLLNKYGLSYSATNEFNSEMAKNLSDTLVHRKGYRHRVPTSYY